jgi:hypothetical protein
MDDRKAVIFAMFVYKREQLPIRRKFRVVAGSGSARTDIQTRAGLQIVEPETAIGIK